VERASLEVGVLLKGSVSAGGNGDDAMGEDEGSGVTGGAVSVEGELMLTEAGIRRSMTVFWRWSA
jgi:hypothetical protein